MCNRTSNKNLANLAAESIDVVDIKPTKKDGRHFVRVVVPCEITAFADVQNGRCTNVRMNTPSIFRNINGDRRNREYINMNEVQSKLGSDVHILNSANIPSEIKAPLMDAVEKSLEQHE